MEWSASMENVDYMSNYFLSIAIEYLDTAGVYLDK